LTKDKQQHKDKTTARLKINGLLAFDNQAVFWEARYYDNREI
jgi:hypothetical protein